MRENRYENCLKVYVGVRTRSLRLPRKWFAGGKASISVGLGSTHFGEAWAVSEYIAGGVTLLPGGMTIARELTLLQANDDISAAPNLGNAMVL